jgi:UDP-3-O-[3-hydroxymyristoyl] glucosamine N-acyltransferase
MEINAENETSLEYFVEDQNLNSNIVNQVLVNKHTNSSDKKKISGVASLTQATSNDLAFCSWNAERAVRLITESKAGIILCNKDLKGIVRPKTGSVLVFVDNPRLLFVRFGNKVIKAQNKNAAISSSSISPTAIISKNNVKIGVNCHIGNYVVIGENCTIGDNTVIHDRVTIAQESKIGKNCVIQSGVTIGEDGFAYERHDNNELEKFPHLGGVIIGDSVEIYSNSNIARGSLDNTSIGDGTKIDSEVQVAHNVKIGKKCQLTAGTIIGGSTVIGDSCWTGLNSTIKNGISLGNNVLVGAGACVIHDVPSNEIVAGVPAKSIKHKTTTNQTFLMAGLKRKK